MYLLVHGLGLHESMLPFGMWDKVNALVLWFDINFAPYLRLGLDPFLRIKSARRLEDDELLSSFRFFGKSNSQYHLMYPVHEFPVLLPSGLTPFPKFDQADSRNLLNSFVRQFVALVVSVPVFSSGYAFCDVLIRGMTFDFAERLISRSSSLDGYPRLLPQISIDL